MLFSPDNRGKSQHAENCDYTQSETLKTNWKGRVKVSFIDIQWRSTEGFKSSANKRAVLSLSIFFYTNSSCSICFRISFILVLLDTDNFAINAGHNNCKFKLTSNVSSYLFIY